MSKFRVLYTCYKDDSKDRCQTRCLFSTVWNEPIFLALAKVSKAYEYSDKKTRSIQKPNPLTLGLSTFLMGFFVAAFLRAFIQLLCFGVRRISMDPQTSIYKWPKKTVYDFMRLLFEMIVSKQALIWKTKLRPHPAFQFSICQPSPAVFAGWSFQLWRQWTNSKQRTTR